jgi:hypothetical protein
VLALPRSPNGKQQDGERYRAENENANRDRFNRESPSRDEWHAPFFAAVSARLLI